MYVIFFFLFYKELLWKAPELLRDPNSKAEGTQKGDVYSFGIILYEIVTRKGPYGQVDKTPSGKHFIHVLKNIAYVPSRLILAEDSCLNNRI